MGTEVTCTPFLYQSAPLSDAAPSLSPFTTTGASHPFSLNTSTGVVSVTDPASLNFEAAQSYNVSVSVCLPQSISSYVNSVVSLAACLASPHITFTAAMLIAVVDVNEPPQFSVASITFSTPAVAVVDAPVGIPLRNLTSDPDVLSAVWHSLSFAPSIAGGQCGAPATQLRDATNVLPATPFTIATDSGQLKYSGAVASSPVQAWQNPLYMCVSVVDGGGVTASVTVTVVFTDVSQQLDVFPGSVATTHYALGVSTVSVAVSYSPGSHIDDTWAVAVPAPASNWLHCADACSAQSTSQSVVLRLNSTSFGGAEQQPQLNAAVLVLTKSERRHVLL